MEKEDEAKIWKAKGISIIQILGEIQIVIDDCENIKDSYKYKCAFVARPKEIASFAADALPISCSAIDISHIKSTSQSQYFFGCGIFKDDNTVISSDFSRGIFPPTDIGYIVVVIICLMCVAYFIGSIGLVFKYFKNPNQSGYFVMD